ncbi:LysR family transcriptional regulator [Limimaricola sp.]|uniref:LysR family transcriptional regulator n=1 Tax=Limimaricola sp. TaxID=2211665 RepID=UPI004058064E
MGQAEDMRAFVRIVDHESIAGAAASLGVAKSAVSRRLRLLEDRLQTQLLVRDPRHWALTEAGTQYYERARDLLADLDQLDGDLGEGRAQLSGTLRLSAPLYFGQRALSGLILDFATLHPGLSIQCDFEDRRVDIVGETYDFVVRIGALEDSALIARTLCRIRHVLVAGRGYLDHAPPVAEPADLKAHRILQYGAARRPSWSFLRAGGRQDSVSLNAAFNSSDGSLLLTAAKRGLGIARLPSFLAAEDLRAGALLQVLPDYATPSVPISALYPATRYQPRRTRALIDFIATNLPRDKIMLDL